MNKCLECGRDTSNPKFCSLSCSVKTQRRNAPRKNKIKKCSNCGVSFDYGSDPSRKFCGHSCAASVTNKRRTKKRFCLNCEDDITGRGKKFCSLKCSSAYRKKEIVEKWKTDPDSATQIQGLSRSIKIYLINEAGERCSQCGWAEINPVTGRSPLEVDHIDGNCYNNDPSNLRVLCPNCHSLTPTYKALNKESKRKYR